jgi:chemotaxis protein MotB
LGDEHSQIENGGTMAGKKRAEAGMNTNAWMTTYTDLMTLLLTFFVLLLSLSTIDDKRKRVALNSVTGAFGFKPGAHSIIGNEEGVNITIGSAPMTKEKVDFEKLRNVALKNALASQSDFVKEHERIVMTLGNRLLFEEGSSRLKPESLQYLKETAAILKDGPRRIELRGYTTHSETVLEPDLGKVSMLLSTKRAMSVFHFFHQEGGIPADRMVAHGFGSATSKRGVSKKKSYLNRQVQIILDYREKIPHRIKAPARRGDSMFDFKGFLFRFPGDDLEEQQK